MKELTLLNRQENIILILNDKVDKLKNKKCNKIYVIIEYVSM